MLNSAQQYNICHCVNGVIFIKIMTSLMSKSKSFGQKSKEDENQNQCPAAAAKPGLHSNSLILENLLLVQQKVKCRVSGQIRRLFDSQFGFGWIYAESVKRCFQS